MKHRCKVIVRKVIYEELESCPFESTMSLRELSRQTGLDATYLSRVKRGKIPVTEATLKKINLAVEAVA